MTKCFILIAVYMFLATVLGLVRGWKYLKGTPDEKTGKEYHQHNERITLTLAGFSLTALALLLRIQSEELTQISSTLMFFSIAFTTLILSSLSIRWRFRNFFIYLSDVFLNTGLLSIGCGLLVFFANVFSWYDGSTIVFTILVVVLFFVSLVNYFFFDRYTKHWRGGEKKNEPKKIRKWRIYSRRNFQFGYLSKVWTKIYRFRWSCMSKEKIKYSIYLAISWEKLLKIFNSAYVQFWESCFYFPHKSYFSIMLKSYTNWYILWKLTSLLHVWPIRIAK